MKNSTTKNQKRGGLSNMKKLVTIITSLSLLLAFSSTAMASKWRESPNLNEALDNNYKFGKVSEAFAYSLVTRQDVIRTFAIFFEDTIGPLEIGDLSKFQDSTTDKYIAKAASLGILNGINKDGNLYLALQEKVTRAQLATLLNSYIEITKLNVTTTSQAINFEDTSTHWANNSIDKLVKYNLMEGYTDTKFYPDDNVKVEEFLVILYKLNVEQNNMGIEKFAEIVNKTDIVNLLVKYTLQDADSQTEKLPLPIIFNVKPGDSIDLSPYFDAGTTFYIIEENTVKIAGNLVIIPHEPIKPYIVLAYETSNGAVGQISIFIES